MRARAVSRGAAAAGVLPHAKPCATPPSPPPRNSNSKRGDINGIAGTAAGSVAAVAGPPPPLPVRRRTDDGGGDATVAWVRSGGTSDSNNNNNNDAPRRPRHAYRHRSSAVSPDGTWRRGGDRHTRGRGRRAYLSTCYGLHRWRWAPGPRGDAIVCSPRWERIQRRALVMAENAMGTASPWGPPRVSSSWRWKRKRKRKRYRCDGGQKRGNVGGGVGGSGSYSSSFTTTTMSRRCRGRVRQHTHY